MTDLHTLLEKSVTGLGYELVDLQLSNHGRLLRLFIDKPEGITVDDCGEVSNFVSRVLAVESDLDYDRLEVSSPGLDRILKKSQDFVRFSGKKVVIKLKLPVDGKKKITGTLLGLDRDLLQVDTASGSQGFHLDQIQQVRLEPEF